VPGLVIFSRSVEKCAACDYLQLVTSLLMSFSVEEV